LKNYEYEKNFKEDKKNGREEDIEYVATIPDPSLMKKAGLTGYSFSEIIAEYVDNSIDAMLDNQKLLVEINIHPDLVEVIDNAIGMNKEELRDAVTLAKCKKEKGKLGTYGLGLKTACVALGRYFEIISLKKGEKEAYKTWWDEEDWDRIKEWKFPIQRLKSDRIPFKLIKYEHGTIVRVKKLRIKVGNKINQLRGDMGKRFAPFINRGIVEIRVNGQPCKAIRPEIMENTKRNINIKTKYGTITGWVALLKNSSQRGMYGFDTFRYGRMITYYDKIGFSPHPSLARIVGELHMDFVPVTTNKKDWIRDSDEFIEAEKAIKEEIKDIIAECRRLASEKRISIVEKNRLEQLKEGLASAIHCDELREFTRPEREYVLPNLDVRQSPLDEFEIEKKLIEIEIEKREKPDNPQRGSVEPKNTGRKRTPKRTHIVKKNQIVVKGKKFEYEHHYSHDGPDGPMYQKYYDKENRKLEIYTNLDFPAFQITEDRAFYAFTHIVESVAMVMVEEANADWEKYDEIRRILLREAANYVAELRD